VGPEHHSDMKAYPSQDGGLMEDHPTTTSWAEKKEEDGALFGRGENSHLKSLFPFSLLCKNV